MPLVLPFNDQATIDRMIKGARLAGLPD